MAMELMVNALEGMSKLLKEAPPGRQMMLLQTFVAHLVDRTSLERVLTALAMQCDSKADEAADSVDGDDRDPAWDDMEARLRRAANLAAKYRI